MVALPMIGERPFQSIFAFCPTIGLQTSYSWIPRECIKDITLIDKYLDAIIARNTTNPVRTLILVDDVVGWEMPPSTHMRIDRLAASCRHYRITLICILQSLTAGIFSRPCVRSNARYVVSFKVKESSRDVFCKQLDGLGGHKKALEYVEKAWSTPYTAVVSYNHSDPRIPPVFIVRAKPSAVAQFRIV
jgi:hypothetical protein